MAATGAASTPAPASSPCRRRSSSARTGMSGRERRPPGGALLRSARRRPAVGAAPPLRRPSARARRPCLPAARQPRASTPSAAAPHSHRPTTRTARPSRLGGPPGACSAGTQQLAPLSPPPQLAPAGEHGRHCSVHHQAARGDAAAPTAPLAPAERRNGPSPPAPLHSVPTRARPPAACRLAGRRLPRVL